MEAANSTPSGKSKKSERRLRVVILSSFKGVEEPEGGVSVHVLNLATSLAKLDGVRVSLISFGDRTETRQTRGFEVVTIMRKRWHKWIPLVPLMRLSRAVKMLEPDVIHLQGTYTSPYLVYFTMLAPGSLPKVATFHGYAAEEAVSRGILVKGSLGWRISRWLEKRVVKSASGIVCVDSRIKAKLIEKFNGLATEKSAVILNGVDVDAFPYTESRLGRVPGLKILNAKALVAKNGQEYLIRAMPEIVRRVPSTVLEIAGDGEERRRLQELVSNLSMDEHVKFLGTVPHSRIPSLISKTDLVAVPSIQVADVEEASSILLVEAMASGKPVVASDIGGLRESIDDGRSGVLVPDRDPEAISAAVIDLYLNPEKARAIAEVAREYVTMERTWEGVAEKHLQLYCKIAGRTN
jgi:glycosyltransferase involved in cell wall biosynthesis